MERPSNTSTLRTFKLTMTIDCVVSSSQSDRTQTPRYVVYFPIVVVVIAVFLLRLFFVLLGFRVDIELQEGANVEKYL